MSDAVAASVWRGVPVLITGGTGFLGVNLARWLVGEGATVVILSRRPDAARTPGSPEAVRVEHGDIVNGATVRAAVERAAPHVVFHLASTPFNPPGTSDREHHDVIVGGASALLSALAGTSTRLVHVGSGAEYGSGSRMREDAPLRPSTGLGRAKAAASRLVLQAVSQGLVEAVIVRPFTPYGPWDRPGRLIIQTALRASEGLDIPISDGRQQRDLLFVDDVVSALVLAATRPLPVGTILNVCSGESTSVRRIVDMVLAEIGGPGKVLPGAIATRADEIWELSGDNTAAARTLGWRPVTPLESGIARTCAWVVEHRALLTGDMAMSQR